MKKVTSGAENSSARLELITTKGGIMSEGIGGFLLLPKNIPKNYLQLSYPVHGNDKVLVGFNILYVKKY